MPGPVIAGIAGSVGSAILGSRAARSAASDQSRSANAQIEETRRQFDLVQSLLKPYVGAGNKALRAQMDLMGIGGSAGKAPTIEEYALTGAMSPSMGDNPFAGGGLLGGGLADGRGGGQMGYRIGDKTFATRAEAEAYANANRTGAISPEEAQRAAIDKIRNGEQFKALAEQGEYGLLANSAATGGLRGGDTSAALAQFRPQMLQSLIDRQLANLGGIAANGQNAAGNTGTAAMNTAGMINASLGDIGAANAGRALASGQAWQNAGAGILNSLGQGWGGGGGGINGNGAWANFLFGGPGLGNLF